MRGSSSRKYQAAAGRPAGRGFSPGKSGRRARRGNARGAGIVPTVRRLMESGGRELEAWPWLCLVIIRSISQRIMNNECREAQSSGFRHSLFLIRCDIHLDTTLFDRDTPAKSPPLLRRPTALGDVTSTCAPAAEPPPGWSHTRPRERQEGPRRLRDDGHSARLGGPAVPRCRRRSADVRQPTLLRVARPPRV